jgi:hypothetical protein
MERFEPFAMGLRNSCYCQNSIALADGHLFWVSQSQSTDNIKRGIVCPYLYACDKYLDVLMLIRACSLRIKCAHIGKAVRPSSHV